MSQYDKTVIDTFLKNQLQLFPERVAESAEEAEEFLFLLTRESAPRPRRTRA